MQHRPVWLSPVPNLFRDGSNWLIGQQFASCSEAVTLIADGVTSSPLAIIATPDRSRDNAIDGADVIHSDCDFAIRNSQIPGEPQRGWVVTHVGRDFRVVDWRDADGWAEATLLRCVRN
jgi:hypothetical protein